MSCVAAFDWLTFGEGAAAMVVASVVAGLWAAAWMK
jgi:hypothetical protein